MFVTFKYFHICYKASIFNLALVPTNGKDEFASSSSLLIRAHTSVCVVIFQDATDRISLIFFILAGRNEKNCVYIYVCVCVCVCVDTHIYMSVRGLFLSVPLI